MIRCSIVWNICRWQRLHKIFVDGIGGFSFLRISGKVTQCDLQESNQDFSLKKSQFLYYFNNQKHLLKTNSFCLDDADDRCIFNASGNLYWLLHQKYSMIFQAQFIFSFCVNTVTRICIHRRSWFDWMNCFQVGVLFSLDKEFTQVIPYFVQY